MKFLLLSFALILPVSAAPAWFKQANIPPKAPLRKISPTKLSYTMSWNGRLKAGNFDILFGKKDPKYPKHFLVHAYGGSTGWAHALYPFQFNYISFLRPSNLRPLMFIGTEKARAEISKLEYLFNSKGVKGSKIETENGKTEVDKSTFNYPHSLDLFAGLLQVRSMSLKNGDTVVMPFHPVATPYLCKLRVLGREIHHGRKCIKMSIALQKIDDDMSLKHYKKLKSATLWISDDTWRIPVEIRAKVFVGDVRVLLTKHEAL
ncbi:MAG: DUF3108 domain-containing protein [Akkermansiaceae bacterium]|nr:DUF3108 domain-containing protein [Akkermansiaceae bacterium]